MKTTVEIPEAVLNATLRYTGARTKRGAINAALNEFNRQRRVEEATQLFGRFKSILGNEAIEALERKDLLATC